jgi:hypothetical protein
MYYHDHGWENPNDNVAMYILGNYNLSQVDW